MTMSEQILLSLLSDGQFHSGEELGDRLSISRAAVWKQLQKIQQLGVDLESVKGRGYRIPGGMDLLKPIELKDAFELMPIPIAGLSILSTTDSTNKQVVKYLNSGGEGPFLCSCEQQTDGRGRRGRVWHSPYGENLYFSLSWKFQSGASVLEGLSLAVGVVIAETLRSMGASQCSLKWPNDIVYEGKKLGGILIELTGDIEGPCQVIIGVGINVSMRARSADIDQPWTDLSKVMPTEPNRTNLLIDLVKALLQMLQDYEQNSFAKYRAKFETLNSHQNKKVCLLLGDKKIFGTVLGVEASGALVVETANGREVFNGGEISLRGMDDTRV